MELADPLHARVFAALPGITGPTALAYRDEEAMLASGGARALPHADGREAATPADIDRAYREASCRPSSPWMPSYLAQRDLARGDLRILGRTIGQVLGRTARP